MKQPEYVACAIRCIWGSLALFSLCAILRLYADTLSWHDFGIYLGVLSLFAALNCRIAQGENIARCAYAFIQAYSLALMATTSSNWLAKPASDIVINVAAEVLIVIALFLLFHNRSSPYFGEDVCRTRK